jgi:carboxylesterase type B
LKVKYADQTLKVVDIAQKALEEDDTSSLLPVMVWIHGGAFVSGSSGTKCYGPEYFMDKKVILVTINYRLNVFGNGTRVI